MQLLVTYFHYSFLFFWYSLGRHHLPFLMCVTNSPKYFSPHTTYLNNNNFYYFISTSYIFISSISKSTTLFKKRNPPQQYLTFTQREPVVGILHTMEPQSQIYISMIHLLSHHISPRHVRVCQDMMSGHVRTLHNMSGHIKQHHWPLLLQIINEPSQSSDSIFRFHNIS